MIHIDIEKIFAYIPFYTLLFVVLFDWACLIGRFNGFNSFRKRGMVFAFACTTVFMLTRWVQSKHLPLSNLYESFIFLSWSFSLLHISLGFKKQNEWSAATTGPGASSTHGFATLSLPEGMQRYTLLVPALQSHWLTMHVSTMLLSYATLLCGSPLSISPPIICSNSHSNSFLITTNRNFKGWIRYGEFSKNIYQKMQIKKIVKKSFYQLSLNLRKYQVVTQLDRWSYQIISLGFSFSTIGILSGSVWANEARGSYWSWDPKETRASVTRLIYAIYLHTRITNNWQGKVPAAVASMGFSLVRIRFLGVNLSGIGLHSYGWLIRQ
uniref:heme attachment to plastid cytochrome c n=1 Tax=Anemia phyllitidis TaxID=12940 RepID=UPI0021AC484D|nr:heme attachment to plastid cytochrome c [Anemia phyllitidis]UUL71123.1 heme attachment to plastid cytochrome c [Anemia phyllitidis]